MTAAFGALSDASLRGGLIRLAHAYARTHGGDVHAAVAWVMREVPGPFEPLSAAEVGARGNREFRKRYPSALPDDSPAGRTFAERVARDAQQLDDALRKVEGAAPSPGARFAEVFRPLYAGATPAASGLAEGVSGPAGSGSRDPKSAGAGAARPGAAGAEEFERRYPSAPPGGSTHDTSWKGWV
ncbi:hypothetical protein [Cellulomonas iranensis]|uniref:Uncharacterized protein n=1 Tax=Cellulomonas iranensis TaxID=76862 RepID=A0ABU0GFZ6_9CELL|nr:hypothetical protein [Cellulomonas iranensis]MDQ0424279.1 hypothetical protein [Cellulomonas iranensis]